ncbi:MAG TPA: ABC transporter substrate-binding protein [Acidiphilium sp.]|uniref:ABC transporter substrate-binding protein n=1 Tax=unclassified Acidiphilium TaxID=2617493 RepID=UPI001F36CFEB|nr:MULTISPECIES: ABC transporter substrate-binding protein [unclassified Acidiphilium]HQT60150.1 ABC transporter substrate-binding protein [Acidiphilium sp.]HQU12321.1 ABC transporter substrate-binding protein [Acidiphilium sp.]
MTRPLSRRGVIAGIGLAGFGLRPAVAAKPLVANGTRRRLLIGTLFPETGPQTLLGDEAWRGVALAIDAARTRIDADIEVIRANAADPDASIQAMIRKAGKAPSIDMILGSQSSTASFAATAAAELAGIPYVELDAPAAGITMRNFRILRRTCTTTAAFTAATEAAIARILAPGWNTTAARLRIALLFDIGATDGSFAGILLAGLRQEGLPVTLSMAHATTAPDLDEEVGRMRDARIDLLIHAGRTDHVLLLYQAMQEARWRPRMIIGTGPGYGLAEIGQTLGGAIDNTMVIGNPLYGPAAAGIAAAYQARYAAPPRGAASLTTHVGTTIAIEAWRRRQKLPAALSAINLPRGSLPNGWGIKFDSRGQNQASFVTLQQWRNGALVTIDPKIPGAAKPVLTF